MPPEEWTIWINKTQDNLIKAENTITTTKCSKFERDQMDYNNNRVYSWHQDRTARYTTQFILKKRKSYHK